MAKTTGKKAARSWKQDPEAVKADILVAARSEFAEHGLSGARVQEIADRISSSKRMIFYYFGDKEQLYRAVLDAEYARVRQAEADLDLDGYPPEDALRRLVHFTFDHHRRNPEFIRLVMIENIHRGRHFEGMQALADINTSAISQLERICKAGQEQGLFRADISPVILHWQISAASFFNVSNRHSFEWNFGSELYSADGQTALCDQVAESIIAGIRA